MLGAMRVRAATTMPYEINDPDDTFERGLKLFNRGDFFACHEVWEELWLRSAGAEKVFYQALIQTAVAILHAERGNLRGAASIWRKARSKLAALPATYMMIALEEFRDALDEFFTRALERGANLALTPRPKLKHHLKSRRRRGE
jgi:predicted metal-dependent hydrolase